MQISLRRVATLTTAAVASAALAVTVATPAGAAAPTPKTRQSVAASWLAAQLTDGVVHSDSWDYDDLGLTLDVALALQAMGRRTAAEQRAVAAVEADASSYVSYGSDVYASSVAKLAATVERTGGDATDVDGTDMIAQLESMVTTDGVSTGRISDDSTGTDYAGTIGQAFAAEALADTGSDLTVEVVDYLLDQQCSAGYFRQSFTSDDTAEDQTCDGGDASASAPSVDVTALAVISLKEVDGVRTKKINQAVKAAKTWLRSVQKTNGAFGSTGSGTANANSTGLASWALGESGACAAAQDAAQWLKDVQVTGTLKGTALAGQKGAIAYTKGTYKTAQTDGITTSTQDQWRRASSQAAPALDNLSLAACQA
ncbi:hypothetical protein [Nocardioides sp. GY 10127]|uniref:hypothetical protein n=1 Tax=Nocardioides sp. GY 10127 TaxID=2569762 RepID=UPI0010A7FDBA|nr:hypothetical protein [Nocardioides sp. GY 10127]TIC80770.1 hypothetical protein E8D37_12925 [Nocardioides sp. GY 10127]